MTSALVSTFNARTVVLKYDFPLKEPWLLKKIIGDSTLRQKMYVYLDYPLMPRTKEAGVVAKGLRRHPKQAPIGRQDSLNISKENNCNGLKNIKYI